MFLALIYQKPCRTANLKRADINVAENEGLTALHLAVYGSECELASFLLSRGSDKKLQ